jgi:hypothetical protein
MKVVSKALEQTSACLTFHGKKIKQSLTEHTLDIDLLGFEEGLSLKERQDVQRSEIQIVESAIESLSNMYRRNC